MLNRKKETDGFLQKTIKRVRELVAIPFVSLLSPLLSFWR